MPENDIDKLGFRYLLGPAAVQDPYPFYRRLRAEDPVHKDPHGYGWIVSRYADVATMLNDPRYSARRLRKKQESSLLLGKIQRSLSRQMLFLDPPDHTRIRTLFAKAFTPQKIEELRPQVQTMVAELLDQAEANGRAIEFINEFAVPLPITVIAQLLGVPVEDRDKLRKWSVSFGRTLGGNRLTFFEKIEVRKGLLNFISYFRKLIELRTEEPKDDFLSLLILAEVEGKRLTREELIVNLILLVAAGHGTTTHLLGNGLLAFARHPVQWKALCEDHSLLPGAINEILRYDAPVQATSRETLEDVVLGGKTIPKGQRVVGFMGSANHDEELYMDPDVFDIKRLAVRNLSFGHGIHTCIGAALARLEAQVAFKELATRYPVLELEAQTQKYGPGIGFRRLASLPISLRRQ